jgi:hyperosmotically inducible protein
MKGHRALLGILAMTAMALAPACRNTAEGVKEDSRQNAEKAREGAQGVGDTVAESAKGVGQEIKEGAKEVGSEVAAGKQTVDVKAALMADRSIDSSHIDVNTNDDTKTVSLEGTVPTAAQKAAAEKVAQDKAEGYKVRNLLTVVKK